MTKIEEIACKYVDNIQNELDLHINIGIKYAMQEYAVWYAKQCLEVAALNATLHIDHGVGISKPPSIEYCEYGIVNHVRVSSESITNIKLPEHN